MTEYKPRQEVRNDENIMGGFNPSSCFSNKQSPTTIPPSVQSKAPSLKVLPSPNIKTSRAASLLNKNPSRAASLLNKNPSIEPRINSIKDVPVNITKSQVKIQSSTIVLVGDSKCGKTSLILSYLNKTFSAAPTSVLFETYEKVIKVNENNAVNLHIWDFPGDDYFDRFRPLGYVNAKCILICFTLDDIDSLNHVRERWIPEIETHCPTANKFIIGIGSEARFDKNKLHKIPRFDYCYKFAKKLGCKYFECTLIDPKSYNRIFEQAALQSIGEFDVTNQFKIIKTRTSTLSNQGDTTPTEEPKNYRKTSFKRKRPYCIVM